MSCSCKHRQQEIEGYKKQISIFRELFIKRMTVDSSHTDRRKKDYNQAIFGWQEEDIEEADPSKTFPCFSTMSMDMVLDCFDNAIKDYRRTFCDVEDCRRK